MPLAAGANSVRLIAAPDDSTLQLVAQRFEMAQGEIAKIIAAKGADSDPNIQLKATLDTQRQLLDALTELIPMLAAEIDRLKNQLAPPR